jgi:hypothetical protein
MNIAKEDCCGEAVGKAALRLIGVEKGLGQRVSAGQRPTALVDFWLGGFECNRLWLLKNSFAENSQKKLCDRKPYKRRSPIWWTFTIPQISAVLAKPEFFNSHA